MDVFAEVNHLSGSGHSEFRLLSETDGRLVLMGGFDLDYDHDVEVAFYGVVASTCPAELSWPLFRDAGAEGELRRYVIEDDEGRYEVLARGVAVEMGKVFHHDPGARLRPRQRIAGGAPARVGRPHALWIVVIALAMAAAAWLGAAMATG
jgi:hypothetical protein